VLAYTNTDLVRVRIFFHRMEIIIKTKRETSTSIKGLPDNLYGLGVLYQNGTIGQKSLQPLNVKKSPINEFDAKDVKYENTRLYLMIMGKKIKIVTTILWVGPLCSTKGIKRSTSGIIEIIKLIG
jgi:hypothetical protein